jgi:hypothetical protein
MAEFLIRLSCRRLPEGTRDERYREWSAELPAILDDPGVRFRVRRDIRALRFAVGHVRTWLRPPKPWSWGTLAVVVAVGMAGEVTIALLPRQVSNFVVFSEFAAILIALRKHRGRQVIQVALHPARGDLATRMWLFSATGVVSYAALITAQFMGEPWLTTVGIVVGSAGMAFILIVPMILAALRRRPAG